MAGCQQVGERQLAEALAHRGPAGHGAGHGHAVPAAHRRGLRVSAVLALEVLGRPGLRRAARGVQAVQRLAVPQQAERVGAEAVADRLGQRDHGRGGNRRVDRVATLVQHAHAGLRRERVRGRHDVAAEHGQALAGVAGGPVEGMRHRGGLEKVLGWRDDRIDRRVMRRSVAPARAAAPPPGAGVSVPRARLCGCAAASVIDSTGA